MFLKLTTINNSDVLYVNIDSIVALRQKSDSTALICKSPFFHDQAAVHVKEKAKDIIATINSLTGDNAYEVKPGVDFG